MIKGIHHACVIVSDMDRSLDFYRDKLGLKEVMNLKFDAFHRQPDFIQGSGTSLDGYGYVYFRGPDNEILEFIQTPN
jgi:catechol 2,3-dioxygenase-like lactoylglutathione lyase family enzyme